MAGQGIDFLRNLAANRLAGGRFNKLFLLVQSFGVMCAMIGPHRTVKARDMPMLRSTYDLPTHPVLAPRRGRWLIAAPLILVVVLAAAWSGLWFYAADRAETLVDNWRAEQAQAGRAFTCGSQQIGGYPFRIEVRCTDAGAELRDSQPPVALKLKEILVVAQVWDPTLLISEFIGPLTAAEPGKAPYLSADWTLAQASVRGTPKAPERASLVVDGLKLDSLNGNGQHLADARHAEFHARVQFGSWPHNPAIDLALKLEGASAPVVSPYAAQTLDADVTAVLHGMKDLAPKPMPVRLREWQAASGRLEIQKARVEQGQTLAHATGTLGLSPRGRLDGNLRLVVAGLERLIPAMTGERPEGQMNLDRPAPALDAINRAVPGIGGVVRAPAQTQLQAGLLALLGPPTELEGKRAIVVPLRFDDGAAKLGPIPIGQVPPVF